MPYHRPDTLDEALEIMATTAPRILGGGTDIYPALKGRVLAGDALDITAIGALGGISENDAGWRIGAGVTWAEVARADLPPAFLALQQAAREVGSVQIQNSATVVGNLCNASPAADGVPPLLVLEAEVEIASLNAVRRVALEKFIQGVRKVDLLAGEMVTAVHIPAGAVCGASAFEKFGARKYLVISVAMVAAWLDVANGVITHAAISVGACSPVAQRMTELESALVGRGVDDAQDFDALIHAALAPIDDIRADAESRLITAAELTKRAIVCALKAAI